MGIKLPKSGLLCCCGVLGDLGEDHDFGSSLSLMVNRS